jgi:hypothetical protein
MLIRAHAAGVRASFFCADEVSGTRDLRRACRRLGMGYAAAVRSNHRGATRAGEITCTGALKLIPAWAWQRMPAGTGSKGARDYDWAVLEVVTDDTPCRAGRHRGLGAAGTPPPLHPHRLLHPLLDSGLRATGETGVGRVPQITIEEDFQTCKGASGLDKGQVTTWTSWHRWSCAALVAYAFLAIAAALERCMSPADDTPDDLQLAPITCPELLRLLRLLILPQPLRDAGNVLHW